MMEVPTPLNDLRGFSRLIGVPEKRESLMPRVQCEAASEENERPGREQPVLGTCVHAGGAARRATTAAISLASASAGAASRITSTGSAGAKYRGWTTDARKTPTK